MINNIYSDRLLKYPLNKGEIAIIDDVWKFIGNFGKQSPFKTYIREYMIDTIRDKYSPHEFYLYEKVANKLFWNLRWLLFPLWLKPTMNKSEYRIFINTSYNFYKRIPPALTMCTVDNYEKYVDKNNNFDIKKHNIYKSTYYRSFINKLVIIDSKNHKIYTKKQEGSSSIFSENLFNLMTMTIFLNKKMYKYITHNPLLIKSINIQFPKYYDQQDYSFPNLNLCVYKFGTKKDRLDRINKMYYNKDGNKSKYWFRLITQKK